MHFFFFNFSELKRRQKAEKKAKEKADKAAEKAIAKEATKEVKQHDKLISTDDEDIDPNVSQF